MAIWREDIYIHLCQLGLNDSDSEIYIGNKISSPIRSGDEIIVPVDLEYSCNMVNYIRSVERKT